MPRRALAPLLALAAGVALAACHRSADRGPAWPASAGTVAPDGYLDDGGESIAPRSDASPVAALEKTPDQTPAAGAPTASPDAKVDPGTPTSTEKTAPLVETIEIQLDDIQLGPGDIVITP